ncbi:MAG: FAD-dependent oxidoreductase [Candidatus Doudnabacteria bacterium]|nr:FAD-dependent oxidoreductase [Candidatus Doudnabacteria bacterium]
MNEVIIIGGGVAAFSAALFAARRGLSVLVLGKDIGGQANFTDVIENYPGLPRVGGNELVESIKKQALGFGAKFETAEVSKIRKAPGGNFIVFAYGKQYKSQSIILAFGKTPKDLDVPGEEEFKGKGIVYCGICDGPLFKNKIVAVVGVGDLAIEEALFCAKFAKRVFLLSKTDKIMGHPALVKAISKKSNIEILQFVRVEEIKGRSEVESLKLLDLKTNKPKHLPINGILVELGYVVKSEFVAGLVKLDQNSQIIVNPDQSTSCEGIFAAGDATNRPYKQATISAGEGAAAGLAAFDWLMRQRSGQGLTSDWTQIKKVKIKK